MHTYTLLKELLCQTQDFCNSSFSDSRLSKVAKDSLPSTQTGVAERVLKTAGVHLQNWDQIYHTACLSTSPFPQGIQLASRLQTPLVAMQVVHAYKFSTQEPEAGGSLQVWASLNYVVRHCAKKKFKKTLVTLSDQDLGGRNYLSSSHP